VEARPIGTVADAIAAALVAYEALTELGEEIEDEWSYVNDLSAAWRDRIAAVDDARGDEPAPPGVEAAVATLTTEATAVDDPHRAIDWLSTFPQVLLIALGERP
jgi:hypothetical protein